MVAPTILLISGFWAAELAGDVLPPPNDSVPADPGIYLGLNGPITLMLLLLLIVDLLM